MGALSLSTSLPRSFVRPVDCVFPPRRVSNVISHFDEFFHFSPRGEKRSREGFKNRRRIDSFERGKRRRPNKPVRAEYTESSSRLLTSRPDPSGFGCARRSRLAVKTRKGIEFTAKTAFTLLQSEVSDAAAAPPHFWAINHL